MVYLSVEVLLLLLLLLFEFEAVGAGTPMPELLLNAFADETAAAMAMNSDGLLSKDIRLTGSCCSCCCEDSPVDRLECPAPLFAFVCENSEADRAARAAFWLSSGFSGPGRNGMEEADEE